MYDHINHEKTAIIIVKCIFKKKTSLQIAWQKYNYHKHVVNPGNKFSLFFLIHLSLC